jgi:hypothetical protein
LVVTASDFSAGERNRANKNVYFEMEIFGTFRREGTSADGKNYLRITSVDVMTYAKKKGITVKAAVRIFDRNYSPTINGWIKKN